jgi:hypothetical protein
MTSLRQIEANRRNALESTGPRSANGKQQSRRNALKHGLTAETVIEPLENSEAYQTFEAAIVAEYLPQTPVERELVHRLASLFWRLRRATSIETGLLRMQGEILLAFQSSRRRAVASEGGGADAASEVNQERRQELLVADVQPENGAAATNPPRDIAISYLRLANLDNELIDRLSRYEGSLWRQALAPPRSAISSKRRFNFLSLISAACLLDARLLPAARPSSSQRDA